MENESFGPRKMMYHGSSEFPTKFIHQITMPFESSSGTNQTQYNNTAKQTIYPDGFDVVCECECYGYVQNNYKVS